MQNLAINNSVGAVDYWEDEKRKALRGAGAGASHAHSNLKRKKVISKLLPQWERQKQKRLESAQTSLNNHRR